MEFDVPATMPDGTLLRANVYRPAGPGPWPVLLARIPYRKDGRSADLGLDPVQVASRGYIVVLQDVRGRYASDGDWDPFAQEVQDGPASVAWAANLPGSTGRVGMFGASYLGYAQWAAAIGRPAGLAAIAPRFAPIDAHDGLVSRGGAIELGLLAAWHLETGFDVAARALQHDRAGLAAAQVRLSAEIDGLAGGGYDELPTDSFGPIQRAPASPGFDAFVGTAKEPVADRISLVDRIATTSVPALHVGGWYDIFLGDTLRAYIERAGTGVEQRLLIGPWSHLEHGRPIGEQSFGVASEEGSMDLAESIEDVQVAWFERHLAGLDGQPQGSPVRLFVMGLNQWRDEPAWPLPDARPTEFYLRGGGRLAETPPAANESPDGYAYDPSAAVPTVGGSTLMAAPFRAGPFDQQAIERRADVLTYTSDALSEPVEATGPINVHLWVSSSAPTTDFVARLCDVDPAGRSINLADGIVRVGQLLEPREVAIDLWATSNVFLAGHRIRIDVTSSSFPRWDRNLNTVTPWTSLEVARVARQQVFHDIRHPSRVVLPVVPERVPRPA